MLGEENPEEFDDVDGIFLSDKENRQLLFHRCFGSSRSARRRPSPHRADQTAPTAIGAVSSSDRFVSIWITGVPGNSGRLSNSQRRRTAAASGPPCFSRRASLSIVVSIGA